MKTRFSQRYDYQRALCEDPKIIREWFQLVRNTIEKYGIVLEDTYNFDEHGTQMGVIGTAKVVTGSERVLRPKLVQPGNTEY
jgi:RecB family endonuclease NucS